MEILFAGRFQLQLLDLLFFWFVPSGRWPERYAKKIMIIRHSGLVLILNLNVNLANVSWANVILF